MLVGQVDARLVDAFADELALVVAAVPGVGDDASAKPLAGDELADDSTVRVDDVELDAVRLAQLEADPRVTRDAVADR